MDENKLRQLWHNFIIYPPKDSEERRLCLDKLLDICIDYFSKQTDRNNCFSDRQQTNDSTSETISLSSQYNNTRYCIGNWLIHQFIIDLGNASTTAHMEKYKNDFEFLNHYFIENIGWKLLKSIYYFNSSDSILYNFGFIQLLVPILKQYVNSYFTDNGVINLEDEFNFELITNQQSKNDLLKPLDSTSLSPAKVKSWIKSSILGYSNGKSRRDVYNSDCDSDEESYLPRHYLKYNLNSSRIMCPQSRFEQLDLIVELDQQEVETIVLPTKCDIISTIVEILIDFIRYESLNRTKTNPINFVHNFDNAGQTGRLSLLIIEEFSPIMSHLASVASNSPIGQRLSLLRPIKNLIVSSCFTACQTPQGVALISEMNIFEIIQTLLRQIDDTIKETEITETMQSEYYDLLYCAIQILLETAKHLIHTKQFGLLAKLITTFFNGHNQLWQSLILLNGDDKGNDFEGKYNYIYKIVDLLLNLQIMIQYSSSLSLHKQNCSKRRHKNCDLVPFMVHHHFHERILSQSNATNHAKEFNCFISTNNHVLVNLIFICSKKNVSQSIDKLICYICSHLSSLISCCWSLKPVFNRLLHFAINPDRSNAIRSSILNIIEFNILNQRKNFSNSTMQVCSFCQHEELCDNMINSNDYSKQFQQSQTTDHSEGYLTDNGHSTKDYPSSSTCMADVVTTSPKTCLAPSCLISSLSPHYLCLLKNDSIQIRQTIFRHLLNLFSYLSNKSKISLLCHIIFPVLQNSHEFTIDVCTFTLKLLIFVADGGTDDLNLLPTFKRIDGFILLKNLVIDSGPSQRELQLLGIRLLESLIQSELQYGSTITPNGHQLHFRTLSRTASSVWFLLQLEPFQFEGKRCSQIDICELIKIKLDVFTQNLSSKWDQSDHEQFPIDPIQDLLKMLINLAFNSSSQRNRNKLKADLDLNSLNLEYYLSTACYDRNHPKKTSIDSLIVSDDLTSMNEAGESEVFDHGYQADTEWSPNNITYKNSKLSFEQSNGVRLKSNVTNRSSTPNQSAFVLKYIDLCRIVIQFLSHHLIHSLAATLTIINSLIRMCKENSENARILFQNNFTSLIMNSFGSLLTNSTDSKMKSLKFVLFDLFIEICRYDLRSNELKLMIDLFKNDGSDYDFLLSTLNKVLFSKQQMDFNQPLYSIPFPVPVSTSYRDLQSTTKPLWIDSIQTNIEANNESNQDCQTMSFHSMAIALPFSSTEISNYNCSVSFWIYLDKINPLIDKFKTATSTQSMKEAKTNQLKANVIKCIHVLSLAFNSTTIELWFDYIYNRFIYRVCKENNGKLIYCNENSVLNISGTGSTTLGRWNFVRFNVEQILIPKSRSSFIKISHSTNCSKDEIIKLTFPVNLLEKNCSNCALLVGSTQSNGVDQFHFRMGNIFLLNQHLIPSGTIFLYSLGSDFNRIHHLKSEAISREDYFILPRQQQLNGNKNSGPSDVITSMHQCILPHLESKLLLKHLVLIYRPSHPNMYQTHPLAKVASVGGMKNLIPHFSRFYPQSTSSSSFRHNRSNRINDFELHEARLYGEIFHVEHLGVAKTISDSGGISIFLFMLCYLFDRCDNQTIFNKSLDLLLHCYESHYQHQFQFDKHYNGYQLIRFVLEGSQRSFTSSIFRVFAQFSIDSVGSPVILSSTNFDVFLQSWKIWSRNLTTIKLFFNKLESLISGTNPYRNYNLAQLRKVNAFSTLLYMIKDMYIDRLQEDGHENEFHLDSESLNHVITIFNSIIDSSTDLSLFKYVFNCILILQKTEWLHVNQTKASFYYLFPSTWLTTNSDELFSSPSFATELYENNPIDSVKTNDLMDWEIVSEMLDGTASTDHCELPITNSNTSCDLVINQLLLLINRFVDQLSEISLIDAIFEQVFCLDFLLVFINTPSDRVREMALRTYFKFYNLYSDKNVYDIIATKMENQNESGRVMKAKSLDLLMLANQLYHYMATEESILACLGFLLELNRKYTLDIFSDPETNVSLRKQLQKVSLEKFIPFLALLPKCTSSMGFCFKTLQMLHRILSSLPAIQVTILQQEYGLVQSLSKLIINFNTHRTMTAEDLNKYTREHVNEEMNRILYEMSNSFLLKTGQHYFTCFANLLHYFSIMERKVRGLVSPVFRQSQLSMFQAGFDGLIHLKNGSTDNSRGHSKLESLDILSEQFIHIINGSDNLASEYNARDYSNLNNQFDVDSSSSKQKDRDLVKPKEALERLKFIVKKATSFIICRDDIKLSQKEIYFQRELLFNLLEIIEFIEMENINRSSKRKSSTWISLFQKEREFFKTQLTQIALFLISPFQSIEDRLFSLNLMMDKTDSFKHLKWFIDTRTEKCNEKFPFLFEAFLIDFIDKGIVDLSSNMSNTLKQTEFPNIGFYDQSVESSKSSTNEPIPMELIVNRFRSAMNMKQPKVESYYKSEIANWYHQLEEHKHEHEMLIRQHVNKIFANMILVHGQVSESVAQLNDKIITAQHQEKKLYIEHLRNESLNQQKIREYLFQLINESLHEKSVWYIPEYYPQSWSLSPFESRNRVRKKLERNFLEIDSRYLLPKNVKQLNSKSLFANLLGSNHSNLFNYQSISNNVSSNSTLLYTTSARVILFDEEIEGEILLKNQSIQFFSTAKSEQVDLSKCVSFLPSKRVFFQDFHIQFCEIQELFNCRYELQNNAVEIYLNSGLTYLISFESTASRDEFVRQLTNNRELLPNLIEKSNLVTLTQLWRERRISNFEYLMHLNKLSGRTSNDLMQYPVFPFVLADYQSDVINLKDSTSFRIFSRPIAVQRKEREKHYIAQFNYIKGENERNRSDPIGDAFQFVVTSAPYHYGSHYSNSGIVLHYLVRLPPYTQMFLQYQDKNFDIPDRTFHSMYTTWRLATEDSTNGFKELIPEFFYQPEFLCNLEQFNLGVRQNGEHVDNVILPPWSRNDARLFTLINRQALESNYVTQHLNQWIDLIFGFQQSGKAAIDACNVFHPATHFSSDLSKIEDEVKRHAIKTMIKTFGQMPNQLFNMPHPSVSSEANLPFEDNIQLVPHSMPEVIGLKWGDYVGSPMFAKPNVCFQQKFISNISRLWALPTNDLLLLPPNSSLLVTYNQQRNVFINTLYIISCSVCVWSEPDSTIWIRNKDEKFLFTNENQFLDQVCICESIPDFDLLLIGYKSGLIVAFTLNPSKNISNTVDVRSRFSLLVAHRHPITSISINKNYSIALSSDSDGVSILWDMSKLQYIRTITDSCGRTLPAQLTCISDTLGDLAVVHYRYDPMRKISSSRLSVWTINGRPIGQLETIDDDSYITSLCYSTCQEGLAINAIATGMSNGAIKLWSSWDLTLIRQIKLHRMYMPIKSISYSYINDLLYLVLEDNLLVVLANSSTTTTSSNQQSSSSSSTGISNRKNFRLLDLTHLSTSLLSKTVSIS
ncbi:hypothetical protein RDWZM_009287 [Blomia tropicalis]|uniref:Lysosomal-trafficking regulator n=1 Tax=Blomia tropicalis TaxID=40697 RepID=A0A9Q0M2U3_BLOTA|nr:hypothetical protein RDWZM_009287 [Blomia tropicalis]